MAVDVILNTRSFDRLAIELKGIHKEIPYAESAAINRTLDFTATLIGKEVRQEYVIKADDVKKTLRKVRATPNRPSGMIESKGRTLTLYHHFKPVPKLRPASGRKYKVKVTIKKGQKRPIMISPAAFVPRAGAAPRKLQVFARTSDKRLPVVVLRSLSVPQMITGKAKERIETAAQAKLEERVRHEIDYRLAKAAAATGGGV